MKSIHTYMKDIKDLKNPKTQQPMKILYFTLKSPLAGAETRS